MSEIKEYTNSVQHNVLATVIDKLNKTNGLTFINVNKISTDHSRITKDIGFKISTIHGMSEILKEIHALGYKITKGK
jgi:hypothetical protein|tara:strand:+ start:42 stop:272 length:231 start_codon:yes stop_codon:yes gene_type:complete